ncbi:peptidoglycan editing factor PgeF [Leptolyngbya sp. PCC 6406]|uniref:peptidoglycan editing factor PgeF n=1 Tax=Leptolyngbya sp. PCC 6406 TaxID=1173264 RepID=UPI0002AC9EFA|nr:peptidoglycan editing factor PgeF [Leptolyngbya sp. PCC 6406]
MNHVWSWSTWEGQPYLTTDLLSPWPHGFFTAQSWPQTPETLTPGLASPAMVYRAQQVHGNRIVQPEDFPPGVSVDPLAVNGMETLTPPRPEADGVMSTAAGQALWVCSADCTPALIADGETGQAVAVHAGWRGTAQKIVPLAIARMQAQGSDLADLRVALGPAIAGQVYQVSTQVAVEVGRSLLGEDAETEEAAILKHLSQGEAPPILPDPQPGRVRLDVRRILARQLTQLGLEAEQVAIAPHCTYQEPERFFSYRRTKEKKVQWSGIVSC